MSADLTKREVLRRALRGSRVASLEQARERQMRDQRFLDSVRAEHTLRFPYQWIAVYDQRVIGPAGEPERVIEELRAAGVDLGDATLAFLDPGHDKPLLL